MNFLEKYQALFEEHLNGLLLKGSPESLYAPIRYIMSQKGKRLRPMLVMIAADACGSKIEDFLDVAYAVEVFHNFTLVHDDIMDNADLRRGKPTVFSLYGTDQSILSGDLMSIQAYASLTSAQLPNRLEALQLFNDTNQKICEGQQMDMDFEKMDKVSIDEYIKMIEYKTAVLLGCSLGMGAIMSDKPEDDAKLFYKIGLDAGIGFQIKDDYLDTFGEASSVGKVIGGDIINSKKTILYILQTQELNESERAEFISLYKQNGPDKVEAITNLFYQNEIDKKALNLESHYFQLANQNIDLLSQRGYDLSKLRSFFSYLEERLK